MSHCFDFFNLEVSGLKFRVELVHDDDNDAPWDREDGHGPVRTVRASSYLEVEKRPGERVLHSDRRTYWLYDFSEAMKIAKRDGWGTSNATPDMNPGKVRELAVTEDMANLSAWLRSEWGYIGVVVTLLDVMGNNTEVSDSIYGIESSSREYIEDEAKRLAESLAEDYADKSEIVKVIKIRN